MKKISTSSNSGARLAPAEPFVLAIAEVDAPVAPDHVDPVKDAASDIT